jgi:hypothetical protein
MNLEKKNLISAAQKITKNKQITPDEISLLLGFQKPQEETSLLTVFRRLAIPGSLLVGALFTIYPEVVTQLVSYLPHWTNLSPKVLLGVDYLWDFIGEPVNQPNILYHLPNIIFYSFGIVGLKALIDKIENRTWLEKVLDAQTTLLKNIQQGTLTLKMRKGHSLVFVGKGDYIGMQFTLNHSQNNAVTISQAKPTYTDIWNYYDISTSFDDLKDVIKRCDGANAGEYIFFPVKDNSIFLPGECDYDLSPHKLDIICTNIRNAEKEIKVAPKRIVVIGDKHHKSVVYSEDKTGVIENSEDVITLQSISERYENVTLLDPTDIVIKKIIEIANGRKIVFRATKEGITEYKVRFYERLELLGYGDFAKGSGVLTIGYDIFEDQTEQQTLSRKVDDYYPVVLSKNVKDALMRNGYTKSQFLYVPELVLSTLSEVAREQ